MATPRRTRSTKSSSPAARSPANGSPALKPSSTSLSSSSSLKTAYLVAFNALSAASWALVLARCVLHMASTESEPLSLKSLFGLQDLHGHAVGRAATSYDDYGELTKWVQSLALMEVLHSLLGLVRSGVVTTVMQVASRIVLVWYVAEQYGHTLQSPFYTTMVFAWSCAEIIRNTHYILTLLKLKSSALEWIRYTAFYVLYPLGAGSEAAMLFQSAHFAHVRYGEWAFYATLALVCIWPPALAVMMSHMHRQRRKHVGARGGAQGAAKKREFKVADEPISEKERKQLVNADGPARSTRSAKKLA